MQTLPSIVYWAFGLDIIALLILVLWMNLHYTRDDVVLRVA